MEMIIVQCNPFLLPLFDIKHLCCFSFSPKAKIITSSNTLSTRPLPLLTLWDIVYGLSVGSSHSLLHMLCKEWKSRSHNKQPKISHPKNIISKRTVYLSYLAQHKISSPALPTFWRGEDSSKKDQIRHRDMTTCDTAYNTNAAIYLKNHTVTQNLQRLHKKLFKKYL